MNEKIVILDCGSQYTQLIARKVRELNVYCEIIPYYTKNFIEKSVKGIIISGSPFSVNQSEAPQIPDVVFSSGLPVLGICYGAQYITQKYGGTVEKSTHREYGRSLLKILHPDDLLLKNIPDSSQVWMSHGDTIITPPPDAEIIAKTENIPVAAFKVSNNRIWGIQFHPEVYHSIHGKEILKNFVLNICRIKPEWTPGHFIHDTIQEIRNTIGNDKVVLGLSGGVDSSVAAILLHKAIGQQLTCIFVNNGLLRKNEFNQVLETFKQFGLNIKGVDASHQFLSALKGVTDPEQKRKIIGKIFIDVFDQEAHKIQDVKWLAQGTIYPDVIESVSVNGPSATIKSHHNVGGLPEKMNLKIIEPLRLLFKDEVRLVGKELGIPPEILNRHPFPGPGLAIRILGEVTPEKVQILQEADDIYIETLRKHNLYDKIWQAGAILLDSRSVGVMGDERTYEYVLALRAVHSTDGMTADWVHLPYEVLGEISNKIINRVKGINRVVYDISSKPPATIEWE